MPSFTVVVLAVMVLEGASADAEAVTSSAGAMVVDRSGRTTDSTSAGAGALMRRQMRDGQKQRHLLVRASGEAVDAGPPVGRSSGAVATRRDSARNATVGLHGFVKQESPNIVAVAREGLEAQSQGIHWVFTTDCSAYMFNQGNLLLASAAAVNQPGEFTWIVTGCDRQEQRAEFLKLAHPRARAFHAKQTKLIHPDTGKEYKDFQASNRPTSIQQWWQAVRSDFKEDAIAIVDPDETWLRPVLLKTKPRSVLQTPYTGPWETYAVSPGIGSGAQYGIGCVFARLPNGTQDTLCKGKTSCIESLTNIPGCNNAYGSGPPWILHRSDADAVYNAWTANAIRVHEAWPDLLAEQGSYGITQAQFGITSVLDTFWFLSNSGDSTQPWFSILNTTYDPCIMRDPPAYDSNLPPLWHSCSTYQIPNTTFRLHKNHIHKDILDCKAPLLEFPPKDVLQRQTADSAEYRDTWSVCAYTNVVNAYAAAYKKRYCQSPNLEASFEYPDHDMGFWSDDSRIQSIFRKGGWTDVDYTPGA